jgi:RNA polymerase-binding transcription factor
MPLTELETRELRAEIERRRATLIAEVRADAERVRNDRFEGLAGAAPDPGDESVATLIADLGHANMSRDLSELRALEAARARLAQGTYGVCAVCGGDIVSDRLRANPTAVRCVDCQRLHEKTFAGPSASSL